MLSDKAYVSGADELLRLREVFTSLDSEGRGLIQSRSLKEALGRLGLDAESANEFLRGDPDGSATIDFEQFMLIVAASPTQPRAPLSLEGARTTVSAGGYVATSYDGGGEGGASAAASHSPAFGSGSSNSSSSSSSSSGPKRGIVTASSGGGALRTTPGGSSSSKSAAAAAAAGGGGGVSSSTSGSPGGAFEFDDVLAALDKTGDYPTFTEMNSPPRLEATARSRGGGGGEAYSSSSVSSSSSTSPSGSRGRGANTYLIASAAQPTIDENPDPRVEEYLRTLDSWRARCEVEGNYEEALRASEELAGMRKNEEQRRAGALKNRHDAESEAQEIAHQRALTVFVDEWRAYMEKFEVVAALYVHQLEERQATRLRDFRDELHKEVSNRPVKFSRDLIEWRARQEKLAKMRKYADAQRAKILADELERVERAALYAERTSITETKESRFIVKLQHEMASLIKKIEARKAEHVLQRDTDTMRLLQRQRNAIQKEEMRRSQEALKAATANRISLNPGRALMAAAATSEAVAAAAVATAELADAWNSMGAASTDAGHYGTEGGSSSSSSSSSFSSPRGGATRGGSGGKGGGGGGGGVGHSNSSGGGTPLSSASGRRKGVPPSTPSTTSGTGGSRTSTPSVTSLISQRLGLGHASANRPPLNAAAPPR